MRLLLILAVAIGLSNCSAPSSNNAESQDTLTAAVIDTVAKSGFDYESLWKLDSYLVENVAPEEIETIDFDCAILVYPNDEQIKEMIKADGEDNFYVMADDSEWYQGTAIGMIDSLGVKTTTINGQFVRLKGSEKSWDLDIRKKDMPAWNIIFFKTNKEPKIISAIDLTAEGVTEYFK